MAQELEGVARIKWIPAGFGASRGGFLRPWFLCPREGCQRRVAILYGNSAEDPRIQPAWACRICLDLCYPSERENRVERAMRKMLKARAKLAIVPETLGPKGMPHETFVSLGLQYLEARKELEEALGPAQLNNLLEQMERERIEHDH